LFNDFYLDSELVEKPASWCVKERLGGEPASSRSCPEQQQAIARMKALRKDILGDSTLRTYEAYYNHAQYLQASRVYETLILKLEKQAQGRHDQIGRKRCLKG
jgi:hypothetical protein